MVNWGLMVLVVRWVIHAAAGVSFYFNTQTRGGESSNTSLEVNLIDKVALCSIMSQTGFLLIERLWVVVVRQRLRNRTRAANPSPLFSQGEQSYRCAAPIFVF